MEFDHKKNSGAMIGLFQIVSESGRITVWNNELHASFKKLHQKYGQVVILVRAPEEEKIDEHLVYNRTSIMKWIVNGEKGAFELHSEFEYRRDFIVLAEPVIEEILIC